MTCFWHHLVLALCRALLKHWVGVLYGLVAILVITPCFGFLMLMVPLQPREFATGLALFCVVPTTLGVGVALTAASKGNQALALLLTVSAFLLSCVSLQLVLIGTGLLVLMWGCNCCLALGCC
jgi:sodium/bile acid cotransporter 7